VFIDTCVKEVLHVTCAAAELGYDITDIRDPNGHIGGLRVVL
jgi:hypothetical protein